MTTRVSAGDEMQFGDEMQTVWPQERGHMSLCWKQILWRIPEKMRHIICVRRNMCGATCQWWKLILWCTAHKDAPQKPKLILWCTVHLGAQ